MLIEKTKERPEIREEDGRFVVYYRGKRLHQFDNKSSARFWATNFYRHPTIEVLVFLEKEGPYPEARATFSSLKCAADWLLHNFNWEWEGEQGPWVKTIPEGLRDDLAHALANEVNWMDHYQIKEDESCQLSWRDEQAPIAPSWFPEDLVKSLERYMGREIEIHNYGGE